MHNIILALVYGTLTYAGIGVLVYVYFFGLHFDLRMFMSALVYWPNVLVAIIRALLR